MNELQVIEVRGQMVLTTKQIAEQYGTAEWQIKQNYANNKNRYIEGKHYILLTGQDLKDFKSKVENFYLVGKTANKLYLWTEKGALLHAKSLNTDKAWEVYDYLVDHYFRAKELIGQQSSAVDAAKGQQDSTGQNEIIPVTTKMEKLPEGLPDKAKRKASFTIPKMDDPIMIFHSLLDLAQEKRLAVCLSKFEACRSLLYEGVIGIRDNLTFNEIVYELAYELSHALIHYDAGNLIDSPLRKDYAIQAERAAVMLIEAMNIKVAKL